MYFTATSASTFSVFDLSSFDGTAASYPSAPPNGVSSPSPELIATPGAIFIIATCPGIWFRLVKYLSPLYSRSPIPRILRPVLESNAPATCALVVSLIGIGPRSSLIVEAEYRSGAAALYAASAPTLPTACNAFRSHHTERLRSCVKSPAIVPTI